MRRSVESRPNALRLPGSRGTNTVRSPRTSMSRHAVSGPDPPNAQTSKSRTSSPRLTVTWRIAFAWFQAAISSTPAAHASTPRPTRRGQPRVRGLGGRAVERDLAADQVLGDVAEQQEGVGRRRLAAAVRVARGPRAGPGRARPDLQRPLRRRPGDRPAAGADRDDVDHRDLDREAPDRALGGQARLPVADHRDVGRRAAGVERDHAREARLPGDQRGAERARPPARTGSW